MELQWTYSSTPGDVRASRMRCVSGAICWLPASTTAVVRVLPVFGRDLKLVFTVLLLSLLVRLLAGMVDGVMVRWRAWTRRASGLEPGRGEQTGCP
jgi:hypothetical protein